MRNILKFFTLALLIISCSSKEEIDDQKATAAINRYLEKNMGFIPAVFPRTMAKTFIPDEKNNGYLELVRKGVLSKTETTSDLKTFDGLQKDVPSYLFELTEIGKKDFVEGKGLKYGSMISSKILSISEPSKFMGKTMVGVKYELSVFGTKLWYNEIISNYFKNMTKHKYKRGQSYNEKTKLLLTEDGWIDYKSK